MPKYSPDVNLHYRRLAQTMVVSIVSRNKPTRDPKRDHAATAAARVHGLAADAPVEACCVPISWLPFTMKLDLILEMVHPAGGLQFYDR